MLRSGRSARQMPRYRPSVTGCPCASLPTTMSPDLRRARRAARLPAEPGSETPASCSAAERRHRCCPPAESRRMAPASAGGISNCAARSGSIVDPHFRLAAAHRNVRVENAGHACACARAPARQSASGDRCPRRAAGSRPARDARHRAHGGDVICRRCCAASGCSSLAQLRGDLLDPSRAAGRRCRMQQRSSRPAFSFSRTLICANCAPCCGIEPNPPRICPTFVTAAATSGRARTACLHLLRRLRRSPSRLVPGGISSDGDLSLIGARQKLEAEPRKREHEDQRQRRPPRPAGPARDAAAPPNHPPITRLQPPIEPLERRDRSALSPPDPRPA